MEKLETQGALAERILAPTTAAAVAALWLLLGTPGAPCSPRQIRRTHVDRPYLMGRLGIFS